MLELVARRNGGAVSPDEIDWDDYRVFLEVVRAGSFNRAAANLRMTQPTVSRRLMRLEAALGVRLFERDRRGPRLTDEGHRIYNDTSAAHTALTRAASAPPRPEPEPAGECRISMGDGVAAYWMTRFLPAYFHRFPRTALRLLGGYTSDVKENVDLRLQYFRPSDAEPLIVRLATLHFLPFASREYLARHGTPHRIGDLSDHRVLDLTVYLADISQWTMTPRSGDGAVMTAVSTNLNSCLAEAVRHGAGIGLLPSYMAAVDGSLVPIEVGIRYQAPLYVSYRRDDAQRWQVRSALDFLRSVVFDETAMPWFAEHYAPPLTGWDEKLQGLLEAASTVMPDERSGRRA